MIDPAYLESTTNIEGQNDMVLADMANPPEHDFAPAWLKIPSHQQSPKPSHVNSGSHSGRLAPSEDQHDRYKSRHYSTDSRYGSGRSPTHEQSGFRGRDERRQYSNPGPRHHSVDELPWDPDPTANWNYSQFNGHSSNTYGTGFPRRGSSVPRNGQQYSSNGRFEGGSFGSGKGQFHQGKASGRQRYNSGSKSGYSEHEDHINETSGKEEGQGDAPEDAGKESDKSALSNQDFPSLSGAGDDVETSVTPKKTIPSGAWEKPPGTFRVISGRKMQLVKKSISSSSETKSTTRIMTPSSTPVVDTSGGTKVGGQTGLTSQNSKNVASSNLGSSVVLKSMTSVTPMSSSWTKDSPSRSTPVPSSRISPVPSKTSPIPIPSRSTAVAINASPTPINKAPINQGSNNKAPINQSPVNKAPAKATNQTPINKAPINQGPNNKSPINQAPVNRSPSPPSTRSSLVPVTSVATPVPSQHAPATSKTEPITEKSIPESGKASSLSGRATSTSVKSMLVLVDSSKAGQATDKSALTLNKPTAADKLASLTSNSKPATSLSTTPASTKPMSITNMSTTLSSKQTSNPIRLVSAAPRSAAVGSRSTPVFGRPSPTSSSRHPSVAIINRPIPSSASTSGSAPVSLRPAPNGSLNGKKDKTIISDHTPTLQLLTKEPSSTLPTSNPPSDVPLPSPTTLKPKKGDKMDFLNELRRWSVGDVSKEVSQNNRENVEGLEGRLKENGPTSMPKTILQREHEDIKTNGLDFHDNSTATEEISEEERIPNFYPVFSPVKDVPDMSSSLEAEKRLLQEMGWHEHSDNEEGYAPLTEDELREFQRRSQQLKKNGLTRALPVAWNNVTLPISSIARVSLDDAFTSSDSDSSSDEQS